MADANELGLSFDASMTSNDFAANLYDIEVTFVTEAYCIGSIVTVSYTHLTLPTNREV